MSNLLTCLRRPLAVCVSLFLLYGLAVADVGDIAVYREAAAGENITTANFDHDWDTTVREEAGAYSLSGSDITLTEGGHYLALYSARFDDPGDNGNQRSELQSQLRLAGADVPIGWSQCYIRRQNGDFEGICAGGGIVNAGAGDALAVRSFRSDAEADTTQREPNGSSVQLLKLNDDWDYCRLSLAANQPGPNNTTDWVSVPYDTQQELGASFAHTAGSTNIILQEAGRYLVFANTYGTRPSNGTRSGMNHRLMLDGVQVPGSATTVYLRGNSNGDNCFAGAAAIGMIIRTTTAGQVLRVEGVCAANTEQITYNANRTAITIARLPVYVSGIRLDDSGADNFNPNSVAALGWDTELEIDPVYPASFTHNDSQVGAVETDDYLFLCALYDNNDGNQRIKYWQQWRVNGGAPLPFGQSGRYARNDQVQAAGNWSGILLGLNAGDNAEVVSLRLGNSGTLSADVKGLQGLRVSSLKAPTQPLIADPADTVMSTTNTWLGATLTWTGSAPTEVWAYWGTTDGGTNLTWASSNYFGTNTTGAPAAYSNNAVGLTPSTLYYYRFRAVNANGETWTLPGTTFLMPGPPIINNAAGATPGQGHALLNGEMTAGETADATVYWGASDGGVNHGTWDHTNTVGALAANGPFNGDTRTLLTEPWTNVALQGFNIMPPNGLDGRTGETNGTYTLTGAGSDIFGTSDQCHFAYRRVVGDFDVFCRIGPFSGGAHAWRKAGILARETLDDGSKNVMMGRGTTVQRALMSRRQTTDGSSTADPAGSTLSNAYYWVRLTRSGDLFTGQWAEDAAGSPGTWTNEHADVTVEMPGEIHLGLAVTSHNTAELTTATFDNLTGNVHPAVGDLLYGVQYHYRCYATNTYGDDWSDAATFVPEAPIETLTEYRAGLLEGLVSGNIFDVWHNPGTTAVTGPEAAKTNAWPGGATYIYSGEIYFSGAPYNFIESVDDRAFISVDGVQVMDNGTWWDRSTTGPIAKPAGWHPFELRLYSADVSGYVYINPGIQYNDTGVDSLSDGDYWYPEDDGNMSLFRHLAVTTQNKNTLANSAPTAMQQTSATLNGMLDAEGAAYDVYVYWGTTDGGTNAGAWANTNMIGSFSDLASVALSYPASGLAADTEHFYTYEARNTGGSLWAEPSMSFRTVIAPTISNAAATDVTGNSAKLNATLDAGGSADATIYWGTTDGGGAPGAWDGTNALGAVVDGPISTDVSLIANQAYYYRAYATNASGADWADSTASFNSLPPAVSIGDATVTEGNSGATTTATFTVTLSTVSATATTCDFGTAGNSAVPGADFVATTGSITIPAGGTSTSVTVVVRGDALDEGVSESFTVELSNPGNATIADGTGTGTIVDDDIDMSAWKYKMKITFSGYDKAETLTNFPALTVFNESIPGFEYAAFNSATGGDLRFMDASETTLLNYEIEEWDTNGDSPVWVQVPLLVDSNTYIWAYGGNPYRTDPHPSQTNGATWSQGYEGVWHMSQPSPLDSTAYGRHGVANDNPQVVDGPISSALSYDGVDDWATVDYVGVIGSASRTVSAWINKAAGSPPNKSMVTWGRNTGEQKWVYRLQDGNGAVDGNVRVEVNGGYRTGTTDLRDGQWHHVACVLAEDANPNINDLIHYVDGTNNGTDATQGKAINTQPERSVLLAADPWDASRAWDGLLDEVRISSVARSADWLWAEHQAVVSNATFMAYGAPGPTAPAAPLIAAADGATNVLDTTAHLTANVLSTGAAQTSVSVYWGTESGGEEPAYWANSNFVTTIAQAPPVTLSHPVGGLTPNTDHHFAYQAVNAAGENWVPGTFRTPGPPSVTNAPATDIAAGAATLHGELLDGKEGQVSIFWGLSDEGQAAGTWDHTNTLSVSANGAFSAAVTPRAGGTYYYRCYVTNAYGDDWTDLAETLSTLPAGVSIADATVTEGNAGTVDAVFAVTLSAPPALAVTVDYDSSNLTAEAGSDYTAATDTLTIPAGVTTTQILVSVNGDAENEWPWQEFALHLGNITNAVIADGVAIGRIVDDDLGSGAWGNRLKIAFGGYTGQETLTNFPALVVLNEALDGFSYSQVLSPIGADLRFMDAARREMLDFEIEQWNTNGDSFVWVRVPKVVPTDAAVWAFWNNPALTGAGLPPSQDDGSVWNADHMAVYHMDDTEVITVGTNLVEVMPDETANDRNAVRLASQLQPAFPQDAPGIIAGSQEFAGLGGGAKEGPSTNMHNFTHSLGVDTEITNFTVLAWAKSATNVQDQYASIFNNNAATDDFQLDFALNGTDLRYNGDPAQTFNVGMPSNWFHEAVTCDGTSPVTRVYFNGSPVSSAVGEDNTFGQFQIGCNRFPDHTWQGWIDEVRVLNRVCSADWIAATYMNTASNAAFMMPSTEGTLLIISDSGTGNPAPGLYSNAYDSVVVADTDNVAVQGGIQYINRGWSMTGNAPVSGTTNQVTMTVTNDAVLTWLWDTNFWLDTEAAAYGSVAPGDQWVPAGSNVTVVGTPDSNYTFGVWVGDGAAFITGGNIYSPTVTVTVTGPVELTAVFDRQPVIDNGPVQPEYGVADLGYNLTDGGAANVTVYWGPTDGGTNASSWAHSIGPNGVAEGTGAFQTVDPAYFGMQYYYRCYAMNTDGEAWATSTAMFTARDPNYEAGLRHGTNHVGGGSPIDITGPNPGTAVPDLGPGIVKSNGAPSPWAYDTTFMYDGQIYFNGGSYVFIERIDDYTWLNLDGQLVMNNGTWSDHSYSPILSKPAGWYDFELRFHQGGGGGGWVNNTASGLDAVLNPGFQYNTNGIVSATVADYTYPEDDGSMSLFRYHRAPSNAWARIHNASPTPGGISTTSLVMNATLEAYETVFDVYVHYGTTDMGTTGVWDNTTYVASYTNVPTQPISHTAGGLTPDTEYFYAFSASNALVQRWGEPSLSAWTVGPPEVDNDGGIDPAIIWGNALTMNGNLTQGGAADVTVYWGVSDGGTNAGAWENTNTLGTLGHGAFSSQTAANLLYGLQYYYRCYANNTSGEDWADTSQPFLVPPQFARQNGLNVETYNNRSGDTNLFPFVLAPIPPDGTHTLTGDLDFNDVNPDMMAVYPSIVNENNITVLWRGTFEADVTGTYSFGTQSDDGSMIFLDLNRDGDFTDPGELVVDNRGPHGDVIVTANIDLTAGHYPIAITFYESGGGDTMRARWGKGMLDWNSMAFINGTAGPFFAEIPVDIAIANAAPSDMTAAAATFSGSLTAPNAIYAAYVYWGDSDGGTNADLWANTNLIGTYTNANAVALTYMATGLPADTEIFYAFGARNVQVHQLAEPSESFRTVIAPLVGTAAATVTGARTATLNASLAAGGSADVTLYWGATDGGTAAGGWDNTNAFGLLFNGPFSLDATNLLGAQTYYYHAYATNSEGSAWSATAGSFTMPVGAITIADAPATLEGDSGTTPAVFTLSLSVPSGPNVTADYVAADGTAQAGRDFEPNSGTVTFTTGQTNAQITVLVRGDIEDELVTPETYTVDLSNPVNATLADTQAASSIIDDDTGLNSFQYRMKIVFSGYTGTETLTNFPALVTLNNSLTNFDYAGFAAATGGDLRFMNAAEDQELNYEVERWDTNGDSSVWVQVPELVDSTTYIWACWGNPQETQAPTYTTDGSTWSQGYEGVWHMNEPNSTDGAIDSTAEVNTGVPTGTPTPTDALIAGGRVLDGSHKFTVGSNLDLSGEAFTLSSWANRSPAVVGNDNMWFGGGINAGNQGLHCGFRNSQIWFGLYGDDANCPTDYSGDLGSWHYYTWVMDGAHVKQIYRDGVAVTTGGNHNNFYQSTGLEMGANRAATSYNGILDELRASPGVARSADWIEAEYLNMASNAVFNGYGPVEDTIPGAPMIAIEDGPTNILTTSADVSSEGSSTGSAQTVVWVHWGEHDGGQVPGFWDNSLEVATLGASLPETVATNLTGLNPNTMYYYAYQATNSFGSRWAAGQFETFGPPVVENTGASGISLSSATLNGDLVSTSPTDMTVYWGMTDGSITPPWEFTNTQSLAGSAPFSLTVPVLADAEYWYTCYGTNAWGDDWADAVTNFTTPEASLSIADATMVEADADLLFTVTLSHTSATAVAVDFATADGTATAGSDYTQTNGTLTIPAGSVSGQIAVPVIGDTDVEWPSEAFTVTLSGPVNASLTDTEAVGTIEDNDVGMDAWTHRMQIGLTGYTGTTTLSNFPALVVLNTGRAGFSYDQFASPTGEDLRFTDGTGTQLLDYEIETWDTNGDSVVWVRIPELANNTDAIVAYWGRTGITAPPAVVATDTWQDGYEAVWHMTEPDIDDSTINERDGANGGNADADGMISRAQSHNNQAINCGSSINLANRSFTISTWVKRSATGENDYIFGQGPGGDQLHIGFRNDNRFTHAFWGDDLDVVTDGTHEDTANWYFWVCRYTANPTRLQEVIQNGVIRGTRTAGTDFTGTGTFHVGGRGGGSDPFRGLIDESRIAMAVRSDDWILARYEMEKPGSTFLAYNAAAPQFPTIQLVSAHGTTTPSVGLYTNVHGTTLTNSVTSPDVQGSTEYVCTGWSMMGNDPVGGSTNTMTMIHTNYATLTWLWETNALNDLGDLPASYAITLLADNGAGHLLPGTVALGSVIDAENDGQESANADGDDTDGTDDEDGIAVVGGWQEGVDQGAVEVTVTGGSGYLSGWIDWAGNDQFTDPGDQVFDMVLVPAGVQTNTFTIPAGLFSASGTYYRFARFRLWTNSTPALTLTGLVVNGEVEDYRLQITIDNLPPMVVGDSTGTVSGVATVIDVLGNDMDPDGDPLTITNVTQGAKGSVVITAGGSNVTYTSGAGLSGFDQFTYWVSDGQGGGGTGLVTVAIDPLVTYVSAGGSNTWPYADWSMAANDIQTAVDAVVSNGTVWVTNGTYSAGGATVDGMPCRVALTKPVTVRSVNGKTVTTIVGQGPVGFGAVRCLYMTDGASLSGFTLRGGATRGFGGPDDDIINRPWPAPPPVYIEGIVEEQQSGGGVRLDQGGVLSNCVVRGNSAFARGGGVWCDGGGRVYGCTIVSNAASLGGGASLHDGSVLACEIMANAALTAGGGVHSGSPGLFRNCLIVSNSAPIGGGVSLVSTGAVSATVQNCTIASNTATLAGGGLNCDSLQSPGPAVVNTIIYYNSAPVSQNWVNIGPVVYTNACTTPTNGLPGPEHIDAEPLFSRIAGGGYHLRASSPCKNTGTNEAWMVGGVDLDGAPRIVAAIVDRGAYEYQNATDVVLYNFWLQQADGQVVVHWQTASEVGTVGFQLYRKVGGAWVLVNTDGLIPAKGAPLGGIGASYAYVDAGADPSATHTYKLVEITLDGTEEYGPFERSAFELRLVSPLTVLPDGGVAIRWLSRVGDVYRVYSADSLFGSFEPLSGPLPATPPENVYTDRTDRATARYYQIRLEE